MNYIKRDTACREGVYTNKYNIICTNTYKEFMQIQYEY